MCIIYGYDLSYKEALAKSGLSNLYERRSELCETFFNKIFINRKDKLENCCYSVYAAMEVQINYLSISLSQKKRYTSMYAKRTYKFVM